MLSTTARYCSLNLLEVELRWLYNVGKRELLLGGGSAVSGGDFISKNCLLGGRFCAQRRSFYSRIRLRSRIELPGAPPPHF